MLDSGKKRPLSLPLALIAVLGMGLLLTLPASADEWTHWRGPYQNGVSDATDLPDTWSKDGRNLVWRQDFTGRSTPVVFDGRVCANGRMGEGIERKEAVACWDAETGEQLWKRGFSVYHTSVPWNRVGWGDVAGDPETGYLYVQFVNGRFAAFDRDGNTAWEWRLYEDWGRFSGYGGRTNTPIVDEDRVIAHVIGAPWGSHRGGGDRWVAFDKKTGEMIWVTEKGGPPKDLNTYATPVIAVVDGRRQLIGGGADGWVYGFDARTGESLWKFHLSQRGLNSSPVVDGTTVYISHSEENVDTGVMGRVVAFDIAGASGDITGSAEKWRIEELQAGYVSPAFADGTLYVADNSANLFAIDAATGEKKWEVNYGTVGKGSPVLADGKIYVTEVNGNIVTIHPPKDGEHAEHGEGHGEPAKVYLEMPAGNRYAEVYASPAIGYGRLYFVSEEGIYCVGNKDAEFEQKASPTPKKYHQDPAPADAAPATLKVVPAVAVATHDESVAYHVRAYDAKGRSVAAPKDVKWSVDGVAGTIDGNGKLTFDGNEISGVVNATVKAEAAGLSASADVRVAGPLPWSWDFESTPVDKPPAGWMGVGKGAHVEESEDSKILVQPKAPRGAPRATFLFGPSSMTGYTIQADAKGNRQGRRLTDVGVVNNGYTLDLQGAHQRIQLISWSSERRMMQQFPFEWEVGAWYTLKLRVDFEGEGDARKAIVRGKVWKRGEAEPAEWTATAEDPMPIDTGSPGLYTFAPVESYFDNVKVMVND